VSSAKIERVQRTFDTFNAGISTLPEFWAEDAEVWPAPEFPGGGPFRGREQIQHFFNGLLEGWEPDTRAVPREFEEAGDKVLISFEWRATGEASGLETSSEWMAVYTIRRDKIVRLEFFTSRDAALTALRGDLGAPE
jgi:ketosteroid isomerase-like protein